MVVEHAHGLRQRRGPNAKSSLHKAHLAPDAGLQAPGASLSFAQGSHDFESLERGIGRGDRFETAALLQRLAAVRGRLSLCADQAAAAKWWLSMPMASVSAEGPMRSEEHTSELQSLMRMSYAVFCLKKKTIHCDSWS